MFLGNCATDDPKPLTHNKTKFSHSGQTFVEFLLLLLVLMGISFAMIKGFNSGIGERWEALVRVIAAPSNDTIELL